MGNVRFCRKKRAIIILKRSELTQSLPHISKISTKKKITVNNLVFVLVWVLQKNKPLRVSY